MTSKANQYLVVRRQLKEWERSFQREHNRKPSSKDIKAQGDIASMYMDLKKLQMYIETHRSSPVVKKSYSLKKSGFVPRCTLEKKNGPASCESSDSNSENSSGNLIESGTPKLEMKSKSIAGETDKNTVRAGQARKVRKVVIARKEKIIPLLETVSISEDPNEQKEDANKRSKSLSPTKRAHKRRRTGVSDNFVRLDLKNSNYKPKSIVAASKRFVKPAFLSKKAYVTRKKIEQAQERNDSMYMEFVEPCLVSSKVESRYSDPPITSTDPKEILQQLYGYSEFREGQLEAINNIVENKSTLLILPTGFGKSIVYQIASFLCKGTALVVSPLISLVEDQMQNIPSAIPAAAWTGAQSFQEVRDLKQKLLAGQLKILFVSPERLFTSGFVELFTNQVPISFCCIDEAHCLSQWSHNFRPCYLRIGECLKSLNVNLTLALTATATLKCQEAICKTVSISQDAVVKVVQSRVNLKVSVSRDHDRVQALFRLLRSPKFRQLDSIIVYVSLKMMAEEVARQLQAEGFSALSYHAGKHLAERRVIQEAFMSGKTRIIVATIAFGMGLDKEDVRAVIHLSTPRTIENYAQEIGRAGRDGKESHCHCFFSDEDIARYRSLSFSKSLDRKQMEALFTNILSTRSSGELVALPHENLLRRFFAQPEVVETLLCFLQSKGILRILPNAHAKCSLAFHKTDPDILGQQCSLVNIVWKDFRNIKGRYSIPLQKAAALMKCTLAEIQKQLMKLRSMGEVSLRWKEWSFFVEIIEAPGSIEETNCLIDDAQKHFADQERHAMDKVNLVGQLMKAAAKDFFKETSYFSQESNELVHESMNMYFEKQSHSELLENVENCVPECERLCKELDPGEEPQCLVPDIKVLLHQHPDLKSSLDIARILHGIPSAKYPTKIWKLNPSWKKHMYYPFERLKNVVDRVLENC